MIDEKTKQLYQEVLLDHNKNPRNFRAMKPYDAHAVGNNPLCGDKLVVYLKLGDDGTIEDVSFIGEGCAISKASASMMTKALKGKPREQAEKMMQQFHDMATGKMDPDSEEHDLGHLSLFKGVRDLPARVKCATLAWHTVHAAIEGKDEVTTE